MRSRVIVALTDTGCFVIAYLTAAYFEYPIHKTFVLAVTAHALLLVVALSIWFVLGFCDALFVSRRTHRLCSRSLGFARVFFGWIVLVALLVAVVALQTLGRTELLAFCAFMLLIFAGRFLLRFSVHSLRLRVCTKHCALKVAHGHVATRVFASVEILLDKNTVRGSPCLDRIGHAAA